MKWLILIVIIYFIIDFFTKYNQKAEDRKKAEKKEEQAYWQNIEDKAIQTAQRQRKKRKPTTERYGLELVQWRENKAKYLLSPEWQAKRQERLLIDNHQCQLCKTEKDEPLNIHHLTYANLYNENVDIDLITLHESCHQQVHNYIGYYSDDEMHPIEFDKIKGN